MFLKVEDLGIYIYNRHVNNFWCIPMQFVNGYNMANIYNLLSSPI
jgi:hypothetical protein